MFSKRGKTALFQISILLISIFAFAILSSQEVSNENNLLEKYCKENPTSVLCDPPQKEKVGSEVASQKDLPPPSATLPTSISKSQKYYEKFFGDFSAAPKGATEGSAEKGYTIEGSKPLSSGFGYSVSNIIGNAAYAAGIFIFIKSVGGMFVDDDGDF